MIDQQTTTERPGQKLGLFATLALVMGNMIGTGIFLLPAQMAPLGWNGVAGWVVTIGGAVCLAHVLARLAAERPDARGVAALVESAFGPLAGFLIGFSFWVSIWSGVITVAVGAVSYASTQVPLLGAHPAIAAFALIWMITAINLAGLRVAGGFQVVTLLLKLIPLLVVFTLIVGQLAARGTAALAPFPQEGLSLPPVAAAAALALWAMVGFEAACAAGDKVADPAKTIPRATMIGATLTGMLYLLVCSGITLMLPADEVAVSAAPFALFVSAFWSPGPAALVALFATISAIGTLNGNVLLQGETPRVMAAGGMMPRWFAHTDGKGTPQRALILSSLLASLLLLANGGRTMGGLFAFMALLSTCSTLWLYLACSAAALKARIALPTVLLGGTFALWALWGAGPEAVGLSLLLMVGGLPLYWWTRRGINTPPH